MAGGDNCRCDFFCYLRSGDAIGRGIPAQPLESLPGLLRLLVDYEIETIVFAGVAERHYVGAKLAVGGGEVPDPPGPTLAPRPGPEIQEPPPAPVEVPQPGIPATPDRDR